MVWSIMCNFCKHLLDLKFESVYSVIENEIKISQILTKTIGPSPDVNQNTLDIVLAVVSPIILYQIPVRWFNSHKKMVHRSL